VAQRARRTEASLFELDKSHLRMQDDPCYRAWDPILTYAFCFLLFACLYYRSARIDL